MMIRGLLVSLVVSVGTLAHTAQDTPPAKGNEPPDKMPEKSPWEDLKDPHVRTAKAKYDAALEKARKEYEARLAEAKKTLLSDLKDAEVGATKDGNLDRALAIRGAKTAADELPTTADWFPGRLRQGAIVFKGVQYRVFLGNLKWSEARTRCKQLGGDLAVLDTPEKRAFFKAELGRLETYIGAYRGNNGQWTWVNGKALAKDAWLPGRPVGGVVGLLMPEGLVGDGADHVPNQRAYLCEWPLR